ncbi:MAG: condensation domain-containing protein, partial [Arenimonas sp.]
LNLIDLSTLPPEQREAEATRQADRETNQPFDLSVAPLLRATLLRLGRDHHVLVIALHHIVSDAWSLGVLMRELAQLYDAFCDGRTSPLADLPVQFPDAVLWQRELAQERRASAQLAFWHQALAGCTGLLDLPTDRPRSSAPLGRGGRQPLLLPAPLINGVAELARREGATLFMALLAAFQCLLARYSGQDDIVVGTPVANRGAAELEPLIGLFVNTLPLRGDLSGDPSFRQLLARTKAHCLDALDHAEAPLERIVDELRIERVPGRTPLFQTMFVLQNASGGSSPLRGLASEWIEPELHTARFELTLSLGEIDAEAGMSGVLDYDLDLFEPATAERMTRQFETLLRAALADPDRPLSQLCLLSGRERSELLQLGDGGAVTTAAAATEAAATESCLYALFAQQAALTPDAVALVEPGRELSYAELLRRTNGLGQRLQALGVGPEVRVAVLTDRSAEAIIAVLGVLAAGGAYVPLDPAHPDERLNFLLADASAQVLLAPPAWLERARALGNPVTLLSTDAVADADTAPVVALTETHAAYVIYTSGSTGLPKGVVVEQRGAVNLVRGFMARHDFVGQRLLMIPPLVFDASVGDVFPVLASGSALVLHPTPTELGPSELERFCRDHQVTAIDAPAALWRRWSEG